MSWQQYGNGLQNLYKCDYSVFKPIGIAWKADIRRYEYQADFSMTVPPVTTDKYLFAIQEVGDPEAVGLHRYYKTGFRNGFFQPSDDYKRFWGMALSNDLSTIYLSATPVTQGVTGAWLYAVDVENMTEVWKLQLNTDDTAMHIKVDSNGTIYVSNSTHLYAVNPDGTLKWEFDSGLTSDLLNWQPVAIYNNTIYIVFLDYNSSGDYYQQYLYKLDLDGNEIWHTALKKGWTSPLIVTDNGIYNFSPEDGGTLQQINSDGTLGWSLTTIESSNLYDFYLAGTNGKLLLSRGDNTRSYCHLLVVDETNGNIIKDRDFYNDPIFDYDDDPVIGPVIVGNDGIYLIFHRGVALLDEDGEDINAWRIELQNIDFSQAIMDGNMMFIEADWFLYALGFASFERTHA